MTRQWEVHRLEDFGTEETADDVTSVAQKDKRKKKKSENVRATNDTPIHLLDDRQPPANQESTNVNMYGDLPSYTIQPVAQLLRLVCIHPWLAVLHLLYVGWTL